MKGGFEYKGDGVYVTTNGLRCVLKEDHVGYVVQIEGETEWIHLAKFECDRFGFKKEVFKND